MPSQPRTSSDTYALVIRRGKYGVWRCYYLVFDMQANCKCKSLLYYSYSENKWDSDETVAHPPSSPLVPIISWTVPIPHTSTMCLFSPRRLSDETSFLSWWSSPAYSWPFCRATIISYILTKNDLSLYPCHELIFPNSSINLYIYILL